ncbi:conserved hypothetical protein, conserved [Delftia acidovorans SPH-1]|uniref:ABC transporter substrate-binding protein n=2 Tax=Comamonadaceae TaxID=80864 RepID=A9BVX0_DELAS|nr:conserved hypothetical protein, conserved [Delftia acidovorans SPH-1]
MFCGLAFPASPSLFYNASRSPIGHRPSAGWPTYNSRLHAGASARRCLESPPPSPCDTQGRRPARIRAACGAPTGAGPPAPTVYMTTMIGKNSVKTSFRATASVIALAIASLTVPTLAQAKRMGSGGKSVRPASIGKAPAQPAAPAAPTASKAATPASPAAPATPATPAAPAAPAAAAAPAATPATAGAAGPGMMGTLGAAAVGAVAGSMAGNALAGAMTPEKDAAAKEAEAKAKAAETEAAELQRKADEAKAKAEAARAAAK